MVNNKQNHYIPAAYKQGEPCWFSEALPWRLWLSCCYPVASASFCTSPWPLEGLSSDPLICCYYVKVVGELIGKRWLLNDTPGGPVALRLVCEGSVKTPHRVPLCPSDSTFPRTFSVSPLNNGQLCFTEESLSHWDLIPYLAIWPFKCSPASIF